MISFLWTTTVLFGLISLRATVNMSTSEKPPDVSAFVSWIFYSILFVWSLSLLLRSYE